MFCVLWHFGDWISRTAILSATEKGVLFDLLVFYYTVERAITREECKRIARAYSQEERDAMQYVLQNFFIEDGDSYKNNRCEEEIAKAKENSEKKRSAANARWSKQGSSKDKNSETDVSASGVDMQKQCTRIPDALQTNNHKPITTNQVVSSTPNVNADGLDDQIHEQDPDMKEGLFTDETPIPTQKKAIATCPYEKIKALYGEVLPELAQPVMLSSARKSAMKARWQDVFNEEKITTEEEGLNCFRNFFGLVRQSKFLMGRTSKFKATLDWLMKQENFLKVCEGKYRS